MAEEGAVNAATPNGTSESNPKPASLDVNLDKNRLPDNVGVSTLVNSTHLITSQTDASCQAGIPMSTVMTSQEPTCTLTPMTTITSMGEESQAALLFLLNSSTLPSQTETTTSCSGLSSFGNAVFVPQPVTISVMPQGQTSCSQNSCSQVTSSDGNNVIEKAMDLANVGEKSSDNNIQHPVANAALTLVSLGNAVGHPVQEIVIDESGRSSLSHDSNLGEVSVTVESEGSSQMASKSQVGGCTMVASSSGISSEGITEDKAEIRTQVREITTQTGAGEKEVVVLKAMKKPVSKSLSLVDQSLERKRLAELKEAQKDVAEKERTHPCDKCEKKFFTKHDLKRHSLVHSEVRPYECQTCKKAFRTPNELKLHLPVHNTNTPYKCEFCGKEFRTKGCIKSHIKYHIGDKRHKCTTCDRAFVKSADLKRHVAAHNNEKKFKCDECDSMFTRRDNLKAHMLLHSRKSVVTCKMCNKEFINEVYLKRHMHIHKQAKKKPYECQWCPKTYEQLEGLRRHIRQHVGDEKFVCEHCAKKFITAIQLKRHLWLSHEQNSPYRKSVL